MVIKTKLTGVVLVLSWLTLWQCSSSAPRAATSSKDTAAGIPSLDVNTLEEGTEIQSSGEELMDYPGGLIALRNGDQSNDSVLVVAVHGYQSRGYEWVTGLKHLAEHFGALYFYRYDWQMCPDQIGQELAATIRTKFKAGHYQRILVFGHSYGGLVVTYAAAELGRLKAEIHVIAAPLSGFPGLLDDCGSLVYDQQDKLVYPPWKPSVAVIQHKTVHSQDGAFRDLASDPQEIDLPFRQIIELPPTMDGHRLGHNWSVSWVLDEYVGRPHRY